MNESIRRYKSERITRGSRITLAPKEQACTRRHARMVGIGPAHTLCQLLVETDEGYKTELVALLNVAEWALAQREAKAASMDLITQPPELYSCSFRAKDDARWLCSGQPPSEFHHLFSLRWTSPFAAGFRNSIFVQFHWWLEIDWARP